MEMSDKKSFPNLKYLTFYKTYFFNIFLNVIFKTKQNDIHVHYTARYFTSEFKKFCIQIHEWKSKEGILGS